KRSSGSRQIECAVVGWRVVGGKVVGGEGPTEPSRLPAAVRSGDWVGSEDRVR
ncbi:hypothetical protein A2U01_0088107, partial [Trifolium medium]|nr:hypothetical protein [Trifolium medium]